MSKLMVVAVSLVVAGCVGEFGGPEAGPGGAEATTIEQRAVASWQPCAVESGRCAFTGTARVLYGTSLASNNVVRQFTNGADCNNDTFGDPHYGVVKSCWYEALAGGGGGTGGGGGGTGGGSATGGGSPTGPTLYFSDCQAGAAPSCVPGNNANAGTLESPKRTVDGINLDTVAAGTRLLFARGGAWTWATVIIENFLTTAQNPLVFDAWGSGNRPVLRATGGFAFVFGSYNNTTDDGGYTLRNLRIEGGGGGTGLFLTHNLHDVVLEDVEITNFYIAIETQSRAPFGVRRVLVRNSSLSRNLGMGILGQLNDSVIENNLFEGNNFSGSGFNHAMYLSGSAGYGGVNVVIRNNRVIRNSVVNGECTGGNITVHGQLDGVLIEGNRVEQDRAAGGCWAVSITQGYTTAEWFRNFVVRNNTIINVGNTAINAQSAPGIVVEGNVVINQHATPQTAISVGHNEYGGGDVPDGDAIVRNNTACFVQPDPRGAAVRVTAPNSQVTNNVTLTGDAATTGVCAR